MRRHRRQKRHSFFRARSPREVIIKRQVYTRQPHAAPGGTVPGAWEPLIQHVVFEGAPHAAPSGTVRKPREPLIQHVVFAGLTRVTTRRHAGKHPQAPGTLIFTLSLSRGRVWGDQGAPHAAMQGTLLKSREPLFHSVTFVGASHPGARVFRGRLTQRSKTTRINGLFCGRPAMGHSQASDRLFRVLLAWE